MTSSHFHVFEGKVIIIERTMCPLCSVLLYPQDSLTPNATAQDVVFTLRYSLLPMSSLSTDIKLLSLLVATRSVLALCNDCRLMHIAMLIVT